MTITELIAKLEAVRAEHGDLQVLSANGEADYDEHRHVFVGEFVPSGNQVAGGDWAAREAWKPPYRQEDAERPEVVKAVYLRWWHEPDDDAAIKP